MLTSGKSAQMNLPFSTGQGGHQALRWATPFHHPHCLAQRDEGTCSRPQSSGRGKPQALGPHEARHYDMQLEVPWSLGLSPALTAPDDLMQFFPLLRGRVASSEKLGHACLAGQKGCREVAEVFENGDLAHEWAVLGGG